MFRDLLDWKNSESQFLKDVAAGEIKFLFSDTHSETSRARDGKNPPIFAAIRYLAKLAQYEVKGTDGDLEIIKKIVNKTDWKEVKENSYVSYKLDEFGRKVLLNAPDSEYAWNLLEETGLRMKLIEMDGDQTQRENTLSWWMNKEPLRSKEIGKGDGKTAGEIFKDSLNEDGEIITSHETNSFLAYENITRSSKGKANVFISRRGVDGEAAAYGDGFYTLLGDKGARGTNLTIRFRINPEAREGTDFIAIDNGMVIILNQNAVRLIQEDINIDLIAFLKLLDTGEIEKSDKGVLEKFTRKFQRMERNSEPFQNAVKFVEEVNRDYFSFLDYETDFSQKDLSLNKLVQIYYKRGSFVFDESFQRGISKYENKSMSEEEVNILEKIIKNIRSPKKMYSYLINDGRFLDPSGLILFLKLLSHQEIESYANRDFFADPEEAGAALLKTPLTQKEKKEVIEVIETIDNSKVSLWNSDQINLFYHILLRTKDVDILVACLKAFYRDPNRISSDSLQELIIAIFNKSDFEKKHIEELRGIILTNSYKKILPPLLYYVLEGLELFDVVVSSDPIEMELFQIIHKVRNERFFSFSNESEKLLSLMEASPNSKETLKKFLFTDENIDVVMKNEDLRELFMYVLSRFYDVEDSTLEYDEALLKLFKAFKMRSFKYEETLNIFRGDNLRRSEFLKKLYMVYLEERAEASDFFDRDDILLLGEGRGNLPFVGELIDKACSLFKEKSCQYLKLGFLVNYEESINFPRYLEELILDSFDISKIGLTAKNSVFSSEEELEESVEKITKVKIKEDNYSRQAKKTYIYIEESKDLLIARLIFNQKKWGKFPHLMELLIERGTVDKVLIKDILSKKHFSDFPFLVGKLIEKNKHERLIIKKILSKPFWYKHQGLIKALLDKRTFDDALIKDVFSKDPSFFNPEFYKTLVHRGGKDHLLAEHVFSKLSILENLELLRGLIEKEQSGYYLSRYVLSRDEFLDEGLELLPPMLTKDSAMDEFLDYYVFSKERWKKSVLLKAYLGEGLEISSENLRSKMIELPLQDWLTSNREKYPEPHPVSSFSCKSILQL